MSGFKLINEIMKLSEATNWDGAKKEWLPIENIYYSKTARTCLCGHYPIKEIIILRNRLNNNKVTVGNCCINKFFSNKSYNKIFQAISKNKINRAMIDIAFEKELLKEIEFKFCCDVWRKRYLTPKQEVWFGKLKKRILDEFRQ
jgi:hypothetical protein